MTNLSRITGKIFGETATATGADPEIGQFGSGLAGTYVGTDDVAIIQNLPAWSNGFIDSVTPSTQFPPLPEMTGFGKVLSHQYAYLLQKGVAEWDSGTTYYTGDFAKGVGEGKLYVSKVDNNINHALTDDTYWEEFSSGAFRNIGEIVPSTIPLTDAGLHLLDGALINYGSYSAFVDYIADLYDSGDYPTLFDTEANWQTAVTTYGVCGKFVYDSVNNTVRLPKYGNQIITKTSAISTASTVPVVGNGMTLGLTDGNNNVGLWSNANHIVQPQSSLYGSNVGTSTTGGISAKSMGVTTDGTKSGIVADISSIKNYPLDCYYYIVIATSTKTQIQVDIDEIATDLNGKMDTDGTNAVSSVKFADGQWVKSELHLAYQVTSPTTTNIDYDLSSYLPNDNYSYEVLFVSTADTGTTSNSQCLVSLSSQYFDNAYIARAHTKTSSLVHNSGCAVLPIGSNHIITVNAWASNTGEFALYALAYRRIGTNQ